jgi:hypothetical protein
LWGPFYAGANQPIFHHPGIQECLNEFQQPLVLDPFGDLTHQFVVIDPIENFLQIKINAPALAFGNILLRLRWLAKGDVVGQVRFIERAFGLAA